MKFVRASAFLLVFLFLTLFSAAQVSLPSLLADHMVVQRGLPVHVWGMAAAQENVSATFRRGNKIDNRGWTGSMEPVSFSG